MKATVRIECGSRELERPLNELLPALPQDEAREYEDELEQVVSAEKRGRILAGIE